MEKYLEQIKEKSGANISFDFDGVLSKPLFVELAKFLSKNHNIFITSSRNDSENRLDHQVVYDIADEIGIPYENIRFTRFHPKYESLEPGHFLANFMNYHFDDDELEIELIEEHCHTCKGIYTN